MDSTDLLTGTYKQLKTQTHESVKMRGEQKHKKHLSYDQIMKEREKNDLFMTGKKYKKGRGAMGKLHKKKKGKH